LGGILFRDTVYIRNQTLVDLLIMTSYNQVVDDKRLKVKFHYAS